MHSRLLTYLNKTNLLDENKFGFQKNKSTENAIVKLLEKLYDAINNKEYLLAIFVDYQKAIDTINHYILQNKLYRYGIRRNVLNLVNVLFRNVNNKYAKLKIFISIYQ